MPDTVEELVENIFRYLGNQGASAPGGDLLSHKKVIVDKIRDFIKKKISTPAVF